MPDNYYGEDRRTPQPEKWHLKKEVNISIIATLVIQIILFSVWAGKIDQRVTALESSQAKLDLIPERLARLEAILIEIKERINRERR